MKDLRIFLGRLAGHDSVAKIARSSTNPMPTRQLELAATSMDSTLKFRRSGLRTPLWRVPISRWTVFQA